MDNTTPQVLVVGATGALGRPVVAGLCRRGVAVRALSRHPEQGQDLAALGAEMVAGDLTDAASLARACAGCTHVMAAAHGLLGRGRWRMETVDDAGHRALIAAARAKGVRRFVYTSAYGAGPASAIDFFRTKHAIEQALAASGLDVVVLRPTAFMEHHAHNFNGRALLEKGKVPLIGPGTKPRNFVCAEDVAAFALRALLEDPPPFRVLDIGGPGHHSNLEVTALYARAAGVPASSSHMPKGVARVAAMLLRPLHPGAARILALQGLPDSALPERFDGAAELQARYGIRLTTLEDFVRQRVAAVRGG